MRCGSPNIVRNHVPLSCFGFAVLKKREAYLEARFRLKRICCGRTIRRDKNDATLVIPLSNFVTAFSLKLKLARTFAANCDEVFVLANARRGSILGRPIWEVLGLFVVRIRIDSQGCLLVWPYFSDL